MEYIQWLIILNIIRGNIWLKYHVLGSIWIFFSFSWHRSNHLKPLGQWVKNYSRRMAGKTSSIFLETTLFVSFLIIPRPFGITPIIHNRRLSSLKRWKLSFVISGLVDLHGVRRHAFHNGLTVTYTAFADHFFSFQI